MDTRQSYIFVKSLISTACCVMARTMLENEAKQEISKILLSNDTVQGRIGDFSPNTEKNVAIKLKMIVPCRLTSP